MTRVSRDGSRRRRRLRRGYSVESRGGAAAATWTFRGGVPQRPVAAPSASIRAAAATWTFRGDRRPGRESKRAAPRPRRLSDESRRPRGRGRSASTTPQVLFHQHAVTRRADIPRTRRGRAAAATWIFCGVWTFRSRSAPQVRQSRREARPRRLGRLRRAGRLYSQRRVPEAPPAVYAAGLGADEVVQVRTRAGDFEGIRLHPAHGLEPHRTTLGRADVGVRGAAPNMLLGLRGLVHVAAPPRPRLSGDRRSFSQVRDPVAAASRAAPAEPPEPRRVLRVAPRAPAPVW